MKRLICIVLFVILLPITSSYGKKPMYACKADDIMFCYDGWVFIEQNEHPSLPIFVDYYYCNATNRTIACWSGFCECVTNCEPLPDGD